MRALRPGAMLAATALAVVAAASLRPAWTETPPARDPAAWGKNHVGKPVPEYVHGDECLFCHRQDVGSRWQHDTHALAVRHRDDAPEAQKVLRSQPALLPVAAEVEFFLGSRHQLRFLKKDGYGRFALLSTRAVLGDGGKAARDWTGLDKPAWDKDRFAARCAGCHATGIDAPTRTFSAFGLDCYVCHGDVDLQHSSDPSRVFLSKKSAREPQAVTSTCAQCHLREGRSRSTGLPYPNNFVPGDNLFQDFEVDLSRPIEAATAAADGHVVRNVRSVVLEGGTITCLSCHQVHGSTSEHRRVRRSPLCDDCHEANMAVKPRPAVHSALCEY